ncbi:hypothetical protein CDD82_1714 [Ophiocordyceps australis]|uniref:Mediator of RNA polymerase II transcription subunit 5 n=1 Tax=Ophiocordyceps australis TaxID=1399860 RepID=A0A2C5ZM59_9HYPO|nr:hypothetical protein CDD82_1714 [Ophiocordyceps australis]
MESSNPPLDRFTLMELGDDRPNQELVKQSVQEWSHFAYVCLRERIDVPVFKELAIDLYSNYPLPRAYIGHIHLRPYPKSHVSIDPRTPLYIQVLTQLGYVDAPSILTPLYNFSSMHRRLKQLPPTSANPPGEEHKPALLWDNSAWAEEVFFYHVIKMIVEGSAYKSAIDAYVLINTVAKWMKLFASVSNAIEADVLGQHKNAFWYEQLDSSRAALVPLVLRLVETPAIIVLLKQPSGKGIRRNLAEGLARFVPTLPPGTPFTERLEMFRCGTLAEMEPGGKERQAAAKAAMDELIPPNVALDNFVISDMAISTTRVGLYIYLNALLIGRPLLQDVSFLAYLQNRHQGETQSSAINLILASFDVLANAVIRNERPKDAHLLRSFLTNKVPLLLCQLFAPQFSTASSEFCITQALNQVDTSLFPTASLMFDESRSNNPYTESVREDFCTACALHGLVQREHVERILGETSMSYEPSLEKFSKAKLVDECLSDPEKIHGLVRSLDNMDGNVGAVCHALVELIRQLCNSKETMTLKILCSQLAQKPQSLDILLLFEKVSAILDPLCSVLDNWRYDDDQAEYQPVYVEFGAILLLVFTIAYRYNLAPTLLEFSSTESCVLQILVRAHIPRLAAELAEKESEQLSGWIRGLFDSETGGLGDDLMSSCPPQQFYLLAATLFQKIVGAYACGQLNDESLKSGMEYMLDTFLLPSLVPAIRFLCESIWVEQKEQRSVIKILQLIIMPSSISAEARAMLSSVKNLIAKPLEYALRSYQKQDPKNQEIEPLLRALRENLPLSRRTGESEHTDVESWASTPNHGISGGLGHTIQALVHWGVQNGINAMPPSYTHRQLITACKILGPESVLYLLLEEIRSQTDAGLGSIVYDVAVAMVCAPDVTNESVTLLTGGQMLDMAGSMALGTAPSRTLRDCLRTEAEGCQELQKRDAALAEMVVRLYRLVEEAMAMPQPQVILEAPGMELDLNGGAGGLGDAMQGGGMTVDGLDMGMGGAASDLGLAGGGGLETGSDGDLFGGMDTTMDMFGGWDGIDLGGS